MNVKALAERLGCSVSTARGYCASGKIRAKRVPVGLSSVGWQVTEQAVEAFLRNEPRDPRGKKRGNK